MSPVIKRTGAAWPALANAALGGWLFLSPFFLGHYEEMVSSLNAYITGSLIMLLAGYAGQSKETGEDKLVAICALWLVGSPWVLGFNALTGYWQLERRADGRGRACLCWLVTGDQARPSGHGSRRLDKAGCKQEHAGHDGRRV